MSAETLRFDPSVGPEHCAVCRRELEDGEQRLTAEARTGDQLVTFSVCRSCMSEHAPDSLAAIEHDATKGLSL